MDEIDYATQSDVQDLRRTRTSEMKGIYVSDVYWNFREETDERNNFGTDNEVSVFENTEVLGHISLQNVLGGKLKWH